MVVPSENPKETVAGMVYFITPSELEAADSYEVSDYRRIRVRLVSGREAWVYVKSG